MGGAHGMWTRISVLMFVAGKPEGEIPLRGTGCSGKDNIKMDFKGEN
jgi:hypothetical protein